MLRQSCPRVRVSTCRTSFLDELQASRLHICSHNTTTYLETLAANFPTILFLNPSHWELRPEAKPVFDELRAIQIYHDSPESAARWLCKVHKEVEDWWQEESVQRARLRFCEKFARTEETWLLDWRNVFRELQGT